MTCTTLSCQSVKPQKYSFRVCTKLLEEWNHSYLATCTLMQHELGNTEKPEEIFDIVEHFFLGRLLHLFGTDAN